jgi:hypothetical protein
MRPIFSLSAETQNLITYFRTLSIGAEVSWAEATRAVKFPVTSTTPAYNSARRIVERDHQIVIESIRGFGFCRINASEIVQSADRFFRRVRRGSRREANKQEIAILSNLPRAEMLRATEQLSRLRILETTAIRPRATSNRPEVEAPPIVNEVPASRARVGRG